MFEIIAIIAVVLAIAIAILLILAATKPDTFTVRRATTVKAPPERIFPLINDFHQWGTWSPYETKDPAMKRTYSGTASGKGAVYAWQGNKNAAGRCHQRHMAHAWSSSVHGEDHARADEHRPHGREGF